MRIHLAVIPPSTTAQQKRVRVVHGKPVFFHGATMRREAAGWAALLAPHAPPAPLSGPLDVSVRLVYPYLASTPKKARGGLLPRTTRPDLDGAVKHLIDTVAAVGIIANDAHISRLHLEKYNGPDTEVGITLHIRPWGELSDA